MTRERAGRDPVSGLPVGSVGNRVYWGFKFLALLIGVAALALIVLVVIANVV